MPTVKVSKRNQIAVPSEVRRALNIKPGDRLDVEIQKGNILLKPDGKSWVERLASIAPEIWQGIDAQEYINELRDEWSHRER